MNILLINQDWFKEEWRAAGHNVLACGLNPGLEVPLATPYIHIDTLIAELPGSFTPDRIVIHDNSSPIMFSGFDECSIPTVFYSVDTHHHYDLHSHLYEVFDYTLIAQRDYLNYFDSKGQSPEWMPLWASRYVEPSYDSKNHGAVFVGNINPDLNPERKLFFDALQQRSEILCTQGSYWDIFPFSEIVVNQTVKGDLNFRVFEAMMCGSLLLSEKSGNGLFELFQDGEHLVTYTKNNVAEAAELIQEYLSDIRRARQIARAGREEILARHLPQHRASILLERVIKAEKKSSGRKHFSMLTNFAILALRMRAKQLDAGGQLQALVLALRSGEMAIVGGEELGDETAIHIVASCFLYDLLSNSNAGQQFLLRAGEAYPASRPLQLGKIRTLLNQGRIREAENISISICSLEPAVTFQKVEEMITALLQQ